MLTGAFAGVVGAFFTGNAWLGVLIAMVAGALMALIHAFLSVTVRGNQIVSGAAINIFALGLTTFSCVFSGGSRRNPMCPACGLEDPRVLGDIPFALVRRYFNIFLRLSGIFAGAPCALRALPHLMGP